MCLKFNLKTTSHMALNESSSLDITVINGILKLVNESNVFGKCTSIKQVEVNIQPSRRSKSTSILRLLGKAVNPFVNRRNSFSSVGKKYLTKCINDIHFK